MQPDSQGIKGRDPTERDLREFLGVEFFQTDVQLDLLGLLKDSVSHNEIEELENYSYLAAKVKQLLRSHRLPKEEGEVEIAKEKQSRRQGEDELLLSAILALW